MASSPLSATGPRAISVLSLPVSGMSLVVTFGVDLLAMVFEESRDAIGLCDELVLDIVDNGNDAAVFRLVILARVYVAPRRAYEECCAWASPAWRSAPRCGAGALATRNGSGARSSCSASQMGAHSAPHHLGMW